MPTNLEKRPYKVYRAGPRGLKALLRGEEDDGLGPPEPPRRNAPGGGRRFRFDRGKKVTPLRVLKWLVIAVRGWRCRSCCS
jgi:hypothetical protein